MAAEAVRRAEAAGADLLHIGLSRPAGRLRLELTALAIGDPSSWLRLEDRVGAAAGTLAFATTGEGSTLLRVDLPCGSIVADDVLLTREGIVHLLSGAGVDIVGEAGDGEQLLSLIDKERPDAVVVDIRMPPTHTDEGLVASAQIRSAYPDVAVVLLSQYVEPSYAMRLLEGHEERVGYLLKERIFHPAVLVDALRRVIDGETVVDPTIVAQIMGRKRANDPLATLSARERDVLALVAEGLSNKAVAARLFVTDRTVEAHMAQVFSKLGLQGSPDQHRRVLAVLTLLRA